MRFPHLHPASFVAFIVLSATRLPAQTCTPEWSELFPTAAGLDATELEPWDPDGTGPQPETLYLGRGGLFERWDGTRRSHLVTFTHPTLPNNGEIWDITRFDPDGPGPAPTNLVVAGNFNGVDHGAGTTLAANIVRWNGSTWSPLGSGTNATIRTLFVFDEDAGGPNPPRLFAGGAFSSAGGVTAVGIARWNGSSWSAVASLISPVFVASLTSFDADGAGPGAPVLVAGGDFDTIGGVDASDIARWNGANWAPFGAGGWAGVSEVAEFDEDGAGPMLPRLFAAGAVLPSLELAAWNGTTWSAAGSFTTSGSPAAVWDLHVHDDDGAGPAAPALYAGGDFDAVNAAPANGIARWDGTVWSEPGGGVQGIAGNPVIVRGFSSHDDDGSGAAPPRLYLSGYFDFAGGVPASGLARWDGTAWIGGMQRGLDGWARTLVVADLDGAGPAAPALYVGGGFTFADGNPLNSVARWDGASWSPLGSGIAGGLDAMIEFDEDGTGPNPPRLFVGGDFAIAGGVPAEDFARWDGTSWSDVGGGFPGTVAAVRALAVFDEDGPGPGAPALFAGGWFTTAGGIPAVSIARWDGTSWSAVGFGIGASGIGGHGWLESLTVADLGTGMKLYAGGHFISAGGVSANHIACWDGANWAALGSGMSLGASPIVLALHAADLDGAGPGQTLLYAAGGFTRAGGVQVNRVASWNGSTWSALGAGLGGPSASTMYVHSLATFDPMGTGTGPKSLYAGGFFVQNLGGADLPGIARWDGASWSGVGDLPPPFFAGVGAQALCVFDEDGGGPGRPGLYASGDFMTAGSASSEHIARFGCSLTPTTSFCFGDGTGTACPCANPGLPGRGCNNHGAATGGALLSASGLAKLSADTFGLHATGENATSLTVFWTGNTQLSPAGVVHAAGVRCVSGLKRLYSGGASGGAISRPGLLDASVSVRSSAMGAPIIAGQTRYYFTIYRDPHAATPCGNPLSAVNLTNAVGVQWDP